VEAAKKTLAEAKESINSAKEKQKIAQADCKRLEKEMDDFKNNKDSKLKEIKVRLGPRLVVIEDH
jgi:structural maintenance of chromosome 2